MCTHYVCKVTTDRQTHTHIGLLSDATEHTTLRSTTVGVGHDWCEKQLWRAFNRQVASAFYTARDQKNFLKTKKLKHNEDI